MSAGAGTDPPLAVRIAVDIGGTFTDGIAQIDADGAILTAKELTTPQDPSLAVATVVAELLRQAGLVAEARGLEVLHRDVVHGTTLVTNAILERKGARTGLVVTRGTADTLRIAREMRYDLYDLDIELPEPLVDRTDVIEIDGRLDARGTELEPVSDRALEDVVAHVRERGIESLGICLLHAYLEPAHEERVARYLRHALPKLSISVSNRVANEIREYERMSTVAANAYVQPLAATYLRKLRRSLEEVGAVGPLRIMLSSGGFTSDQSAADDPIDLLESGPAGGVLSALNTAALVGVTDVLTFDMGGTTAKACVATDGAPAITYLFEAARARRFKKGSGLPILVPSIDLIEIGAGGGSIASRDALGLLKVGPQSAGAAPGPVCYGLGGHDPTVTDADLMLGYLDPDSFLGGRMRLDARLSEAAMQRLAGELGIAPMKLAQGICEVVNESMASAARVHVAEKGLDPRGLTMVATGGAGPVHAVEVAHKLGIRRILCSVAAGVGSCLGFLSAPARADRAWSNARMLHAVDSAELVRVMRHLRASAAKELAQAGVAEESMVFVIVADLRYAGQGHSIAVELSFDELDTGLAAMIARRFEQRYVQLYGQTLPGGVLQVVTWRLRGRSAQRSQEFHLEPSATPGSRAATAGYRRIYLPPLQRFGEVPVHDRYALAPGTVLEGPLLLQEAESTVVVARPARVEVLPNRSLSITLPQDDRSSR
ncbi:MAG: hydantoinase/oxoprolinase family protein [Burkholderiaceae bacterium]|jgi:N-methylhydantoinase A|nr:hydantoinase/oxoprolinase family protein [Burkholderiales bacterium]MCZ8101917.1 hydantoinase/oxoprolinase family protein [Burkholderiales bacterium]MCZ8338585.1 hydantoinase/oxoprolinase family protein [Burkholderiaceae bacterium]